MVSSTAPAERRPRPGVTPESRPIDREAEGFTLVEALVVLGILAIQLAFMLPALVRAQEAVRLATCLGNLRQWGIATHTYAADHDDLLPPEGVPNPRPEHTNSGWYVQLPRQLGIAPYASLAWHTNRNQRPGPTLWLCPANPRRSNGLNLFHYCLNQSVDGSGADDLPVRLASIREPGRLVWLFDSKNLPAVGPGNYAHTNLHRDGANFGFLDAHAARIPARSYWDAVRRRPLTNSSVMAWFP